MVELKTALDARHEAHKRYIESLRAFSIEQFGAVYGVGRTRIFEEIKGGRLATYTVGRRRYISVAAADAWQRAREAESVA